MVLRRPVRPQRERGDVVGRQRQQQVRVDDLALVPRALLLGQAGERRAVAGAGARERERALLLRDAGVPVEPGAAPFLERGDDLAQLGVHRPAVVALVVVLHQDLPVGGHVVDDAARRAQVGQRVVRDAAGRGVELRRQRPAGARRPASGARTRSPPTSRTPTGCSPRSARWKPWSSGRYGADRSAPSSPYVHAWYGQRMAPLNRPVGTGSSHGAAESAMPERQAAAAVPAHVVEAVQRAVLRADQQDALAQHVERQEVAGLRDLLLAADAEPLAGEQPLALRLERRGRAVGVGGQGLLQAELAAPVARRRAGRIAHGRAFARERFRSRSAWCAAL